MDSIPANSEYPQMAQSPSSPLSKTPPTSRGTLVSLIVASLALLLVAAIPPFVHFSFFPDDARFLVRNRIFIDDAFYYYQVAYNILIGKGMTFDGINLTNGFQPLWMAVPLALLNFYDKKEVLIPLLFSEALFLAGALFFSGFYAVRRGVSAWIVMGGIFALASYPYFIRQSFLGLETSLTLLM